MRYVLPIVVTLTLLVTNAFAGHPVLDRLNVTRGICVAVGDRQASLALELVRQEGVTVFIHLDRQSEVQATRAIVARAGHYGTRIYVDAGDRIALADNIADAVVVGDQSQVSKDEVMRVLRPRGKALVGDEEWVKPVPAGVDDWSHPYHGPDNNPQSRDQLAIAPYLTQFISVPRYAPNPQASVAAGGRLFTAFGHIAWHEREEPWMNTLVATNGYNGTILWTMPLKSGIVVDRNTLVATPDAVYVGDDVSCKVVDAATGRLVDEITLPEGTADGTFWKWMAIEDGVFYALVGAAEKLDEEVRWRRTGHGWVWSQISQGYNNPEFNWGFANTLVAMDPKTKKVLWTHSEAESIDSRGTCMTGGRIFISAMPSYIACLDARDGRELWRRTAQNDQGLFDTIKWMSMGPSPIGGWKTAMYVKCTDRALYFVGPQVRTLTALSADDGRLLWSLDKNRLQIVIRDDGVYTIGPQRTLDMSLRLDPLTGQVLGNYRLGRRACARATGAVDAIFYRASEGTARLDTTLTGPQLISPMRSGCQTGIVIANGSLYWLPWGCDCNLQMFGVISLGPAGEFQFNAPATGEDRLEKTDGDPVPAKFVVAPGDWPTYRGDNQRNATTVASIAGKVKKQWEFTLPEGVEPTAPVSAGGLTFVAGSDGIVRALDSETGKEAWTAFTGGCVRYPPSVADGRVFVGSGDGWAYAFEAATGRLLWRFRAASVERRIPVFGSLLSTWPVASGVLVQDGVAYFAAGINNFDGTHVYALDAATGKVRWQNNTSGHLDQFSRTGVAVQGDLLLYEGNLYLAGGNVASPGIYDITDGKCLTPVPKGTTPVRGRELSVVGGRVIVTDQPFYSHPDFPVFDTNIRHTQTRVTTANAEVSCVKGPEDKDWQLTATETASGNGNVLWTETLPGRPVPWGLAVDATGRIIVTLYEGKVVCLKPVM